MEQIAINILPKGAKPVCHSSQFDEGRQIRFNLFNDATPYTLSGTETISVLVRKPDGTEVIDSVTNTSDSYVVWDVSADACELSGVCECELSIVENGIVLGSKNFTMKVEEDAYNGKTIEVRTASGRIATFNTNMVEAFKSLKSEINPVQDLHGYSKPWSGGGGKNKFNDTTGTHTINANTDTTITIGDVYLEANTTYTISCKQTPAPLTSFVRNTLSVVGGGTTTYNPAGNDYTIKPMVFTPTVSGTYSIRVWGHTLSANTTYSQFQVEVGNQATAYEPYSNICPISGFSALNVTRTGVNLWDEEWEVGYISVLDGRNSSSQVNIRSKNYIPIKPNVSLYLKANIATVYCPIIFYDKDKNFLSSVAQTLWNRTITTPENAYYMRFYMHDSYGTTYNNDISINYPSSDTEYHAYNGQTATVIFGQTVYGGSLDVTNGKVTITHISLLINSLLNLTRIATSTSEVYRWQCSLIPYSSVISNMNTGYVSSKLANAKADDIYRGTAPDNSIGINTSVLYVRCDSATTVEEFNNLIGDTQLVYELATPIEIDTTPENLSALSGQNNVYADTNGDTEVEYYIEV